MHCVRESPTLAFDDELSTEEWLNVIDDLAAINAFSIGFTGGEATVHRDLYLLIDRAKMHRMSVIVKTNGLTLKQHAPRFAQAHVNMIEVSLYGATAASHERCTKIERSFERTIEGIKTAKNLGLQVHLNSVLFRWNADEAESIRNLALELGCSINRNYLLTTTDLGRNFLDDFCTPSQIRDVEFKWPLLSLPSNQNGDAYAIKACTQGINRMAITARGEILSCISVRKPLGHVRGEGVRRTWTSLIEGVSSSPRRRPHGINLDQFSRCLECRYLEKCNVCLGHNYSATGDFYEPPLEKCFATMSLYGTAEA